MEYKFKNKNLLFPKILKSRTYIAKLNVSVMLDTNEVTYLTMHKKQLALVFFGCKFVRSSCRFNFLICVISGQML